MRLWHKDLIEVLPNKMLVSQWRELSAIVGYINKNGSLNHRLVNIIEDYKKIDLYIYTKKIYNEMKKRNMNPSEKVLEKITKYTNIHINNKEDIFVNWHNKRYLKQCFHNLEEKYDRNIINKKEWELIASKYKKINENI